MIKVGIAGIRGLSTLTGFNAIPDVRIEALCDLDDDILQKHGDKYNIQKRFRVFEDMLESDIDAVVVATPMQLHFAQTVAALEAGKHVLSEVTAGVTMDELWWLIECVEKYGKTYMMAENYCYMPDVQLVKNMVQKGLFGEVYYAEGQYLHNGRGLARYSYGPFTSAKTTWRKFWQLGKRGCFYPTHSVGPVMQWFEGDRIKSLSAFGSGRHTDPSFRQDDTCVAMCQLESGKLVNIRLDCVSNRPHNMTYYQLQGTRGCFEAARGLGDRPKVSFVAPEDGLKNESPEWSALEEYSRHLPERYKSATEEQKKAGHNGGDFFIVEDFIEAVRTGRRPPIDVYDACEWTSVALLSELSVTNGGRAIEVPNFRRNMPFEEQVIRL